MTISDEGDDGKPGVEDEGNDGSEGKRAATGKERKKGESEKKGAGDTGDARKGRKAPSGAQPGGGKKGKARQSGPTQASQADRHVYYERAVQCAEAEIDFVVETFRTLRHRKPEVLREDFCGTANVCCEWVRRHKRHRAIGVDLDAEVLGWGEARHLATLAPGERKRVTLLQEDVLKVKTAPADCILAMNFSYWLFKARPSLRRYFKRVRRGLKDGGLFILDAYGGLDAPRIIEEHTEHDDFTYVWDQAAYNPITGEMTCHIHFLFPDGSALREAFTYHWRLWSLPEIRDCLAEAGFRRSTVYWEGTDEETNEGNGIFSPTEEGTIDPGWIAYIVAEP
jgi:SAM-dependent methyltransferase